MKTVEENLKPTWLLIRLDRIGDLVLTLPADSAVRTATRSEVIWWIPPGLSFITNSAVPRREAKEVAKSFNWKTFFSLWQEVRKARFTGALIFHAPWWVSVLLWLARVPIRGGVKSQWHTFLFLNRAIRQKRSLAECSELEYGYRLAEAVLGVPQGSSVRTELKLTASDSDNSDLFHQHGLFPQRYIVIHPGMGGSALNWPIENYAELVKAVAKKETVVITGTANDEPYLAPLSGLLKDVGNVYWAQGKFNSRELLTILQSAKCIVAPSTGVLHLAASTGQPSVGIYSPVLVQHPKRWGPQGPRTKILIPKVDCPGKLSCLGAECPHFDCMKLISTAEVLAAVQEDFPAKGLP